MSLNKIAKIAYDIKNRKEARDVFYTPIELVDEHLNYIKEYVNNEDIILDPFFGTGNYFNLFDKYFKNNTIDYTEIALDKDFFEYNKKVDVIVSNPPYSILDDVFKKSIDLNPHTISYLIGVHNLTTRRIEMMNNNGYFLIKIKMVKVYKWFGMSCIVVFRKGGVNCIDFDRKIYK